MVEASPKSVFRIENVQQYPPNMQSRPTRAIVDALTPTPESFAKATGSESTSNAELSFYTLNSSILAHFPPVKAIATDPPTENLHRIASLPHLQRVVLKVRRQRRRLRPTTTGLESSTNRLLLQQGHHVADMSLLTGLTYHPSRRIIIAQAGVSIVRLYAFLHKNTLALASHAAPGVNARSVAAAFVTGAQGTLGKSESLFADGIHEVSLVDSSGQLRVFSSTVNAQLFSALRASQTLFGIIYDVTFNVFPSEGFVSVSNCFSRLTSILSRRGGALRNTIASHGGAQLVWFPYNSAEQGKLWTPQDDLVWVRMVDPLPKSRPSRPSSVLQSSRHKSDDVLSAPPLLRFLSLPQWLTVRKMQLAKAGYCEFRREHALLFVADAFRESAWVLGAGRHTVSALDVAQSHDFDGVRSTRNVSVAFPARVRNERRRHATMSGVTRKNADNAESSSDLSSDTDDDLNLSESDDATDPHDVMQTNGSSSRPDSDGWVAVYAAALSVVRAVRTANENKGEALAATVRLSIDITGGSSACLAATRGLDEKIEGGRLGDSEGQKREGLFVVLTMQAAMSAPGWDELAKSVVRSWSKLPTARWVWDRHSADIVSRSLQEERDAPYVRRFLSVDRAMEVARLRLASGVDDIGMFVDERLDDLMDGLFSSGDERITGSTDDSENRSSKKSSVSAVSHSLDRTLPASSEELALCSEGEPSEECAENDNEGNTVDSPDLSEAPSSSSHELTIEAQSGKVGDDGSAKSAHLQRGQRSKDETRHWLQLLHVMAILGAFFIGVYARELAGYAYSWTT